MAKNRTMAQKNLINKRRTMEEIKVARYRVMSDPNDPRNLKFESGEDWYKNSHYYKQSHRPKPVPVTPQPTSAPAPVNTSFWDKIVKFFRGEETHYEYQH